MSAGTVVCPPAVQTDGAPRRHNNPVGGNDLAQRSLARDHGKPVAGIASDGGRTIAKSPPLLEAAREVPPAVAPQAALAGRRGAPAISLDGIQEAVDSLKARVLESITRKNDFHLEALIRTLIGLRKEQRVHPEIACLGNLANELSVRLENDCDLTEIDPQCLDAFDPTLHHQVAVCETNDASKAARIHATVTIGVMHDGHRFMTYFAGISRYVAARTPAVRNSPLTKE